MPPVDLHRRYMTDPLFYHAVNVVGETFAAEHGLSFRRARDTAILAVARAEALVQR